MRHTCVYSLKARRDHPGQHLSYKNVVAEFSLCSTVKELSRRFLEKMRMTWRQSSKRFHLLWYFDERYCSSIVLHPNSLFKSEFVKLAKTNIFGTACYINCCVHLFCV
jgi:hypothetical protein